MEQTLEKPGFLQQAPRCSGCYIFKDKRDNVIYIGKAKNLHNRVKSYFTKAALLDNRTADLVPRIVSAEYRATPSELDALITEYLLIKQHKPWFNSLMKADKARPYLRIGKESPYPALCVATASSKDGAVYYDCFPDEESVRETLALLGSVWGTARCGRQSFGKAASPCLYHEVGGCMAPCAGKPAREAYLAAVEEIYGLFEGRPVPKMTVLQNQMHQYAAQLEFEKAEGCKRQLEGLLYLQKRARRRHHYPDGAQVVVLARPFREQAFAAFFVRQAAVMARADFARPPTAPQADEALREWRTAPAPLPDGERLAKALTEISVDKFFIQLSPRATGASLARKMQEYFVSK